MAHLSETNLRIEPALALYRRGKLSLGKAAEVAQIAVADLMRLLAERQMPMNYRVADLEQDRRTLTKHSGS